MKRRSFLQLFPLAVAAFAGVQDKPEQPSVPTSDQNVSAAPASVEILPQVYKDLLASKTNAGNVSITANVYPEKTALSGAFMDEVLGKKHPERQTTTLEAEWKRDADGTIEIIYKNSNLQLSETVMRRDGGIVISTKFQQLMKTQTAQDIIDQDVQYSSPIFQRMQNRLNESAKDLEELSRQLMAEAQGIDVSKVPKLTSTDYLYATQYERQYGADEILREKKEHQHCNGPAEFDFDSNAHDVFESGRPTTSDFDYVRKGAIPANGEEHKKFDAKGLTSSTVKDRETDISGKTTEITETKDRIASSGAYSIREIRTWRFKDREGYVTFDTLKTCADSEGKNVIDGTITTTNSRSVVLDRSTWDSQLQKFVSPGDKEGHALLTIPNVPQTMTGASFVAAYGKPQNE